MRQVLELLRVQAPWLEVDGEMHGDVALDEVQDPQNLGAIARTALVETEAERLVVEARHAGVTLRDLLDAIRRQWARTIRRAG